jgi:diketogulonate reductase-like aldo/keto reductase
MKNETNFNRRQFMGLAGVLAAGWVLPAGTFADAGQIRKAIPKTAETLPVIGMGTSRTFDAIGKTELLTRLQQVTQTFFDMGGGMIDSSPMYGSAQEVIGKLLPGVEKSADLFAATKVWIQGKQQGIEQMKNSRQQWGIPRFDLMQIHNLIDWETHLETLKQMKSDGEIRYIGITTSHGRDHNELTQILKKHDFDFVQLSYNIGNRHVESPLLSIAQDKGIAVIVNRPYQRGDLFHHVRGKSLPSWAQEFDCTSWGEYFLKFVVSHPAVTCAIPATSKVKHMQDNMQAGRGRLPTMKQRGKMVRYIESL